MNERSGCSGIEIRSPLPEDLRGIRAVVQTCEPYLTAHVSYVFWRDIRYWRETCAVATSGAELVGWCWMIPTPNRLFLHQVAVAPMARRQGLAESLVTYVMNKFKARPTAFDLELTIDRRNSAALNLFRAIADHAGMQLVKKQEVVALLEDGCEEELYVMTPAMAT